MWFVAWRLLEGTIEDLWFLLNRVARNCMESCIHMNCLWYTVFADKFVNREQGGSSRQVAQVSLNPIWDFSRHGVSRITEIQIVHVTQGSVIVSFGSTTMSAQGIKQGVLCRVTSVLAVVGWCWMTAKRVDGDLSNVYLNERKEIA